MKILISEKLSANKAKTPEGYLICNDAIIGRTGKQKYLKRELYPETMSDEIIEIDRTEDEVFSEATLASFENKPLTCEHPNENVTPDNYMDYAVGWIRDVHKGMHDGKPVMKATLVITDRQCIEDIENGIRTDLSCGYDCDITDGPNPKQINIRGNHVALCEQGRAGIAKIVDSMNDSMEFTVGAKYKNKNNEIFEITKINGDMIECTVDGSQNALNVNKKLFEKWITSQSITTMTDSITNDDYDDDHVYMLSCYLKPDSDKKSKEVEVRGFKNAMETRKKLEKYFAEVYVDDLTPNAKTSFYEDDTNNLSKEKAFNGKYILYKEFNKWKGTPKDNFDAQISNAQLVSDFSDFNSANDIIDYLIKYLKIDRENIIVKTTGDSFGMLSPNNIIYAGTYIPKYNTKLEKLDYFKNNNKYTTKYNNYKFIADSEEELFDKLNIYFFKNKIDGKL